MTGMKDDDGRTKRRRKAPIFFWCLPLLFPATYYVLRALPASELCRFRDDGYLLALWPGNFQIYNQIKTGPLSEADGCFFVAVRSVYSTYFAVPAAFLVYLSVRFARSPMQKSSVTKATMGLLFFGISAMFASGFNDHAHGKYSELDLRTYNTIPVLVLKSLLPMIVFYACLLVWIMAVRSSFGPQESFTKRRSANEVLDSVNSTFGSNGRVDYPSGLQDSSNRSLRSDGIQDD